MAGGRVGTPKITAGADELTDLLALRAHVAVSAAVTVAFAIRRDGGEWRRVAVDDTPPYRAFLDRSAFRKGERVEAVAIARSLGGRTAMSKTLEFTPRR